MKQKIRLAVESIMYISFKNMDLLQFVSVEKFLEVLYDLYKNEYVLKHLYKTYLKSPHIFREILIDILNRKQFIQEDWCRDIKKLLLVKEFENKE
jgi:hypothetical protein